MVNISSEKRSGIKWYVLRGRYLGEATVELLSKEMENRSQRAEEGMKPLEFFAPRLEPKKIVEGRLEKSNRPFIGYIFVRGTKKEVLYLRSQYNMFNLVRSLSGDNEYITVSDTDMRMFQLTVSLYNGHAPFVEVSKEMLEKGDYVRIRPGHQFENVEGTLLTSQGKEGGRVVVSVFNGMAIPTLEIQSEYLEVISFGRNNRHIYQTLDSYHPFIRHALAARLSHTEIEEKDIVRIKNFVARYGNVDFDRNNKSGDDSQPSSTDQGDEKVVDKKIRGRYYAYMLMSYIVLGIGEDAPTRYYAQLIYQMMPYITNPTTKAFIFCVLYAATKKQHFLDEASGIAATWEGKKLSKKQRDVESDILLYKKLLGKEPA